MVSDSKRRKFFQSSTEVKFRDKAKRVSIGIFEYTNRLNDKLYQNEIVLHK